MKRRILTCIALCGVVLGAMAQRSYTFNAVALNVDGLPPSITVNAIVKMVNYDLNGKGPIATETTTKMAQAIANQNWGIVGLSEDFNYHGDIENAVSPYYTLGTHKGAVATSYSLIGFERNTSDGLGLLCSKSYSFTDETVVAWGKNAGSISELINGYIEGESEDNGADELITKGFRCYTVTIDEAEGIKLDVYVLHMDAASRTEDITCREAQLTQLATYIKNRKSNGRHVLVIGDTNCRYTREKVKTGFIDVLDAAGFICKDPWIELIRGGEYPTYGGTPIEYADDDPRDEVVDKIFCISNPTAVNNGITIKANSYHQETSINYSDHYPVVVNFTITNEKGTAADYELPAVDETVETWTDKAPTNPTATITGKQFYMRNVNSGLYLKAGSNWGSHFAEGIDGLPVQMTLVSGNTYKISTPTLERYLGNNYYADNGAEAQGNWIVEEIKSNSNKGHNMTKYIFRNAADQGMAIASMSNGYHVDGAAYNAADTKQQWVLYTYDEMIAAIKGEMEATLTGATYNASGLITQPVCNLALDSRHAIGWSWVPSIGGAGPGDLNESCVWEVFRDGASHAFDMNQTVSGLPNGTYTVKVQAFFRDGDLWTSSTNVEPVFYAGDKETNICSILDYALSAQPSYADHKNGAGWIPNNMWQANQWFKAGYYTVTLDNVDVTDGSLKIGIKNTSTATSQAWCCFDNFQLWFHGTAQGDLRTSPLYKSIKAAADEAIATVNSLNSAEATAAFDISNVAYRYNNNLVSMDGAWEFAAIDNAVKTAVAAQTSKEANMSLLIKNNSFEDGTTGWTIAQNGYDTNVFKNEENNTTANGDGAYYFNTWDANYECGMIYQTVTGLRNGYYRLNAMVTSSSDGSVYLVGNKQNDSIATTAAATFMDFGLDFLVEDGTARIGAVGAGKDGQLYFKKGSFFKADNFRLTYMGSTGEGRVKIALADAKAKAANLNPTSKAQFEAVVANYENEAVAGDGKTKEAAIYDALKAAIASQPYAETDMTWLITNPGFETGDWTGWTKPEAWESVVLHATHQNAPGNSEGQYAVNVWNNQPDIEGSGVNKPTYQTLSGLPNGRYRLAADVTSDNGNPVAVYATTNSETVNDTIQPTNNKTFKTKSIEFDVTDHTATIGAVGYKGGVNGTFDPDGGCWYKCDNFRLTYLGHDGTFADTGDNRNIDDWYTSVTLNRTIKPDTWSTFVVPFDIPASMLEEWEIKELDPANSVLNGDKITIEFIDAADGIKAGVPYMVRNKTMDGDLTTINMTNVQVNTTTADNSENTHVEFVGTYQQKNVPQGAFFISNNVFYQAADDTNVIKAFRAYFVAKPGAAEARSLGYRMAGEIGEDDGTTAIDTPEEEASVVGIYTTGGVRTDELQTGVNILKMSNGSVVKVVIK